MKNRYFALFLFILLFVIIASPSTVLADDQYEWKRIKTGFNCTLYSVAYGDNRLVAVGQGGDIVISVDFGESWLKVNSNTKETLKKVIWGNNQFVSLGGSGGIYTSADGIKWAKTFSLPNSIFQGIVWGNNCYVAVGTCNGNGIIVTSADGVNWTEANPGVNYQWVDVIWGNNEFILIGGGYIFASKDSKEWTVRFININNISNLTAIVYGDNGYTALNIGRTSLLVSKDGIEWTTKAIPASLRFYKIIRENGQYISAMRSPVVGISNDGANWTNIFSFMNGNITDIIMADNYLVGVGESDNVYIGKKIEFEEDLSNSVNIIVNGRNIEFPDMKPFVDRNNRTLVPIRFIAEALGAEVEWRGESSTIVIKKDSTNISLKIGDLYAKVGPNTVPLDSPGRVINERTMVPLRFIAECLNSKVEWDGNANTVKITNGNSDGESDNMLTVIAENTLQLINAIGSNRRILLKHGFYELSDTRQVNRNDNTIIWVQDPDGTKELNIQNISNLTIEGMENEKANIRNSSGLKFNNCNNITFNNISMMTNNVDEGVVLSFQNSNDISIINSYFSGAGSGGKGIIINNVKRFNMSKTSLNNPKSICVLQIIDSETINFNEVKIVNTRIESSVLNIVDSNGVLFEKCEFINNTISGSSFGEIYGKTIVLFDKCRLANIFKVSNSEMKNDKTYFIKTVDKNGNYESVVKFRNSEIVNSKFDYLSDKIEAVIFENCELKNTIWSK